MKSAAYPGRTIEIPDYPEMLNQERELGVETELHEAARNGQVEAVQLLLDHEANSQLKITLGRTALDLAKEKDHVEVVEILSKTETTSSKVKAFRCAWRLC